MLLRDVKELGRFYHKVVPTIRGDECLLLLLNARKKYCPELARSEEVLRREVIRERKWRVFLRKVKKLTTVRGLYSDKLGKEIPVNAFAPYIVLDVKSAVKAWFMLQKEMGDLVYQYMMGGSEVIKEFKRVDIRWFSCLHRTKGRKLYWLIDIDQKDWDVLDKIVEMFDGYIAWVSETRGGFHVIVKSTETVAKLIFKEKTLSKFDNVEVQKQVMTPIPGCLQGGFVVKGLKI